ncbi:MAG: acyl-CoA thioesterase [Ignavibacteriaceae bacterium]|nr:acyl-CoA thioesterase [Ignavibacteriaceae bacterium]
MNRLILSKEIEIKTYDIDAAGHVNNVVYIKWLEDLRGLLYRNIFDFPKIVESGYYPVVTHTSIKYIRQIKLFDNLEGVVELISERHGMLFLSFELKNESSLFAKAEQKCVMMNLRLGKMVKDYTQFRL